VQQIRTMAGIVVIYSYMVCYCSLITTLLDQDWKSKVLGYCKQSVGIFLSQFQTSLIDVFNPFRLSDPILFGLTYTLVFSASKPIGGILFGIAFWIVSKGLSHRRVKDYMIISGYGLLLLFTANQHQVLLLNPYPPFGLPTISYIGLASYLVLVGVYSSALSVANDAELRRSIRKSVQENSDLLGNIGEAQFENQLKVISPSDVIVNTFPIRFLGKCIL
jgi:hypothetical protein